MLTNQEQRNLYGELTNNKSASNLSLGDTLITSETKRIISKIGGNLLESTATGTTVAEVQIYEMPNRVKKLRAVTIQSGTTQWPLHESPSIDHWNRLNSTGTSYTSDIPLWYRTFGRQVRIWPIPASSANTVTYYFDKRYTEQSVLDYTVGSVGTATTNTVTILANTNSSATLWTDSMEGRFINIAKDNNANKGDGEWYEIATVPNGTTIILTKPYVGQNITQGTAVYVIGEIAPLPDGMHELPVYRAAEIYWSKNDEARAGLMRGIADRLEENLEDANEETTNVVLEDADDRDLENPNLYLRSTNQ